MVPDYKRLYTELFNDITDARGEFIQKLQEIQQKSADEYAKESLAIRLTVKKKPPTRKREKEPPSK